MGVALCLRKVFRVIPAIVSHKTELRFVQTSSREHQEIAFPSSADELEHSRIISCAVEKIAIVL